MQQNTICRIAESKDLLGAELGDTILADFLEIEGDLLFENEPSLLEPNRSRLPTGMDWRESRSSSLEDTTEPLLCELDWARSWLWI